MNDSDFRKKVCSLCESMKRSTSSRTRTILSSPHSSKSSETSSSESSSSESDVPPLTYSSSRRSTISSAKSQTLRSETSRSTTSKSGACELQRNYKCPNAKAPNGHWSPKCFCLSKNPRKTKTKRESPIEEKVEDLIDEEAEDESENRRARKELKEWTREAKQGQLKNLEERKSPSKATTYSPVKAKGPSLFGFNTLDQILNRS